MSYAQSITPFHLRLRWNACRVSTYINRQFGDYFAKQIYLLELCTQCKHVYLKATICVTDSPLLQKNEAQVRIQEMDRYNLQTSPQFYQTFADH